MPKPDRLYSPIYWTLSKPKTCLNQTDYSPIYWTLSKPKICLNQTDFIVLSTEPWVSRNMPKPDRLYSPIYWTLSKPKTCLNQTDYSPIYWTLSKPKTCLNQTDFIVLSAEPWVNRNLPKPDRLYSPIYVLNPE